MRSADHAGVDVDDVFEGAVDQDEDEENAAERHEITELIEIEAENRAAIGLAQGVVDDLLGQVERGVEERERQHRHREDDELLTPGIAPNETENVGCIKPAAATPVVSTSRS